MAVSGLPESTKVCPDCGETLRYEVALKGYAHVLRFGCPAKT